MSSKESLLRINNDVLVGDKVIPRRPFISLEERLKNLKYTVLSEIAKDIPNSDDYTINRLTPTCAEVTPENYTAHNGLLYSSMCVGVARSGDEISPDSLCGSAMNNALLKLKSLLGTRAFTQCFIFLSGEFALSFDNIIHCHVSTSADVSKVGVRDSLDGLFKQAFDSPFAKDARIGNAPPTLTLISTPWPFDVLSRFVDLDHLKHEVLFFICSLHVI